MMKVSFRHEHTVCGVALFPYLFTIGVYLTQILLRKILFNSVDGRRIIPDQDLQGCHLVIEVRAMVASSQNSAKLYVRVYNTEKDTDLSATHSPFAIGLVVIQPR